MILLCCHTLVAPRRLVTANTSLNVPNFSSRPGEVRPRRKVGTFRSALFFLATDEQDHSLNKRFKTKRVNSCGPTNRERSSVHMFGLFDVPQSTSNEVRGTSDAAQPTSDLSSAHMSGLLNVPQSTSNEARGTCLSHSLRPRGNLRRSPHHVMSPNTWKRYPNQVSAVYAC